MTVTSITEQPPASISTVIISRLPSLFISGLYRFIKHVGADWMLGVEAIACDMNSDFQEAFEDKCPHLKIVFDHFHIVKYFNDKVIGEVRKDEQNRLKTEGNVEVGKALKGSKHILTAKKSTLTQTAHLEECDTADVTFFLW